MLVQQYTRLDVPPSCFELLCAAESCPGTYHIWPRHVSYTTPRGARPPGGRATHGATTAVNNSYIIVVVVAVRCPATVPRGQDSSSRTCSISNSLQKKGESPLKRYVIRNPVPDAHERVERDARGLGSGWRCPPGRGTTCKQRPLSLINVGGVLKGSPLSIPMTSAPRVEIGAGG